MQRTGWVLKAVRFGERRAHQWLLFLIRWIWVQVITKIGSVQSRKRDFRVSVRSDVVERVRIGRVVRRAVRVSVPSRTVFDERITSVHRLALSIAFDAPAIPSPMVRRYVLDGGVVNLDVRVLLLDGQERVFRYQMPISGSMGGRWELGAVAWLTERWMDHTIDFGTPIDIRQISVDVSCPVGSRTAPWLRLSITPPSDVGIPKRAEERRNIIIVSFDSFTDPAYCYARRMEDDALRTSFLQTLRSFDCWQGIAQTDWTLPAAGTYITGLYPSQHGLADPRFFVGSKSTAEFRCHGETIAQIARHHGFRTFAGSYSSKFCPELGVDKGFENFEHSEQALGLRSPLPVDAREAIRILERFPEDDCFVFIHTDQLHSPHYVVGDPWSRNTPAMFPELDGGVLRNEEQLYGRNLRFVYLQVMQLVQYLQATNQYGNTMVVITGDHGHALDRWHELSRDYPLRESRIRVPYVVHWPTWSRTQHQNGGNGGTREAGIGPMRDVVEALGEQRPSYFGQLPQCQSAFRRYCFSESLHHPRHEDYFLAVRDGEEKYILHAEIDWARCRFQRIVRERLFPVERESLRFDENLPARGARAAELRGVALAFIEQNLEFRRGQIPPIFERVRR